MAGKIVLNAYTFETNPEGVAGMFEVFKPVSTVLTYSNVAVFSWDSTIIGKKVSFDWEYMTTVMFEELRTIYLLSSQVVLDIQDGSGRTFNIEVLNLEGLYAVNIQLNSNDYRKKVKLSMIVMSEI